jgi:phage shock protein A
MKTLAIIGAVLAVLVLAALGVAIYSSVKLQNMAYDLTHDDPVDRARFRVDRLEKKIDDYKARRHELEVESIFRRKKAERVGGRAKVLKTTIQKLVDKAKESGGVPVSVYGRTMPPEDVRKAVPNWHRSYLRLSKEETRLMKASEMFGKAAGVMEKQIETLETNILNMKMKIDEMEILRDEAEVRKEIQDVFSALAGTGGTGEIPKAIKAIEDEIDRTEAELEASAGEARAEIPSAAELLANQELWGAETEAEMDDTKILAEYGLE